jgi:regulator of sigma E protease
MDTLIRVSQFILSLSILIALHEWGHYITAKKTGMRVNKFYLFFDFLFPFANVANFAIFKKKVGDTEYGLGWFPFGGYVQIAGMVDETTSEEDLSKEPEPHEFRAKPAWARLLVMAGGVTVNMILGILIFWLVLFVWGRETLPVENVKYGFYATDSVINKTGFKDGDMIASLNGEKIADFNKLNMELLLLNGCTMQVMREGRPIDIVIPEGTTDSLLSKDIKSYFSPGIPTVVDSVFADGTAVKAGLKKGDKIIAINDKPMTIFQVVKKEVTANKNKDINLTVLRGTDTVNIPVKVSADGGIGFAPVPQFDKFFTIKKETFSFFGALPAGAKEAFTLLYNYPRQFKLLFTKAGAKQIGGFGSMAKQFGTTWDWHHFWRLTGILSIILAFMNILPIPMLDGGYILFLLIEVVSRRKIPEKVVGYANMVGLVLILGLLVFANGNDIYKWVMETWFTK